MPTGPEHYRISEDLLQRVEVESLDDGSTAELIGRALVHATLAKAAAYAMAHERVMSVPDGVEWRKTVAQGFTPSLADPTR